MDWQLFWTFCILNVFNVIIYTINGKTEFWRGSMEETFSYDNLKKRK